MGVLWKNLGCTQSETLGIFWTPNWGRRLQIYSKQKWLPRKLFSAEKLEYHQQIIDYSFSDALLPCALCYDVECTSLAHFLCAASMVNYRCTWNSMDIQSMCLFKGIMKAKGNADYWPECSKTVLPTSGYHVHIISISVIACPLKKTWYFHQCHPEMS